jgi:hypothetical protein
MHPRHCLILCFISQPNGSRKLSLYGTARWVSETELLAAGRTLNGDLASDLRGQKDAILRAIRQSCLHSLEPDTEPTTLPVASALEEDECEIECISDVWVTDDASSIVREYEVKFADGDGKDMSSIC